MITGRQIREARQLLRWSSRDLSERAKLTAEIIERAESTDSTPPLVLGQAAKIQAVCEAAGIRFGRVGADKFSATATRGFAQPAVIV